MKYSLLFLELYMLRYPTRNVLCAVVLVGATAASTSAQVESLRKIVVSGTVVTHVSPDQVEWSIELSQPAMNPVEAKLQVDEWMNQLFEVRDALSIAPEDFKTGTVKVRKAYRKDPETNKRVFEGYIVEREILVVQRDLKAFNDFLAAFTKEGHTFDTAFKNSRHDEIRRQTRIEATKVAKAKAEELAQVLGVEVGMPLEITASDAEGSNTWGNRFSNNMIVVAVADDAGDGGQFTPGAIAIRVTVGVTFELLPGSAMGEID